MKTLPCFSEVYQSAGKVAPTASCYPDVCSRCYEDVQTQFQEGRLFKVKCAIRQSIECLGNTTKIPLGWAGRRNSEKFSATTWFHLQGQLLKPFKDFFRGAFIVT
ncbi:hypothetical protein BgiMline_034032 [Biomphalaria glabrata]|nr:hypothetical protein BgiMline_020234 [Biomphalaria glabrata]